MDHPAPRRVVTHKRDVVRQFNLPTQSWACKRLCPTFVPRQFEYHPTDPSLMVFGTLAGQLVVVDHQKSEVIAEESVGIVGSEDPILGLAWLHSSSTQVSGRMSGCWGMAAGS